MPKLSFEFVEYYEPDVDGGNAACTVAITGTVHVTFEIEEDSAGGFLGAGTVDLPPEERRTIWARVHREWFVP